MPGLIELIVLCVTLFVSLVVSLGITVPLTGALVRLRGEETAVAFQGYGAC